MTNKEKLKILEEAAENYIKCLTCMSEHNERHNIKLYYCGNCIFNNETNS